MVIKMLQIKNLTVTNGNKKLLNNVSINIADNSIHLLSGPNGSGKTSLLMTIMGHPDYVVESGEILFNGKNIVNITPTERSLIGIALLQQHVPEIPGLTVSSYLKHAMSAHYKNKFGNDLTAGEFFKMLNDATENLSIPAPWLSRSINVGFSGGERKKLALLYLYLIKPRLAMIDEPDSGSDLDTQKLIAKTILELHQSGTTFIVISHQPTFTEMIHPTNVSKIDSGTIL